MSEETINAFGSDGNSPDTKILGFLCNWCAYAGADLAGVSRVQYPPDMRVIRLMCSGRIDPVLLIRAFRNGSDGVAVLGCHPGDCHYQVGNFQAMRKVRLTELVLEKIGIDPGRLLLDWVSAAEGARFGEVITGFVERIRDLGPIDRSGDFPERAGLGELVIGSERIRWLVGKELELIEQGNVYHEKIGQTTFTSILRRNIEKEYDLERIRDMIVESPGTVHEISDALGIPKSLVFRYLTELENSGQIHLIGFEGNTPSYQTERTAGAEGGM